VNTVKLLGDDWRITGERLVTTGVRLVTHLYFQLKIVLQGNSYLGGATALNTLDISSRIMNLSLF